MSSWRSAAFNAAAAAASESSFGRTSPVDIHKRPYSREKREGNTIGRAGMHFLSSSFDNGSKTSGPKTTSPSDHSATRNMWGSALDATLQNNLKPYSSETEIPRYTQNNLQPYSSETDIPRHTRTAPGHLGRSSSQRESMRSRPVTRGPRNTKRNEKKKRSDGG